MCPDAHQELSANSLLPTVIASPPAARRQATSGAVATGDATALTAAGVASRNSGRLFSLKSLLSFLPSLWRRVLLLWKSLLSKYLNPTTGGGVAVGTLAILLMLACPPLFLWLLGRGRFYRWLGSCLSSLHVEGGAHLWGPVCVIVVFLAGFIAAL